VIRAVLESLALRYRMVLGWLQDLTGQRLETIHIVGGGTQNRLLSQFTADATGRQVIAGPVEATAAGNVLMQMMALGHIDTLSAAREVVRRSFNLVVYEPGSSAGWDEAYARLLAIMG
jgi:rhamnulokinase